MNTRCHYCGWNFTLSREAVETAVAQAMATSEKSHIEHCPRCRRVIKLPVDQLRRTLPPGWTPPAPEAQPSTEAAVSEPEPVLEAVAEAPASTEREAEAAKPRRPRRAAATDEGEPAAKTAADTSAADKPATKKTAAKSASKTAPKSKTPSGKTAAESSAAKKTARKQPKP